MWNGELFWFSCINILALIEATPSQLSNLFRAIFGDFSDIPYSLLYICKYWEKISSIKEAIIIINTATKFGQPISMLF